MAYDLKTVSEADWDEGYLEADECENYCRSKKELLAPDKTTCCIQARYYYSNFGSWAADCALVDSKSTEVLEDTWNDEKKEYGTFQAFLMSPIIISPEDEIIIPDLDAGEIDDKFDPSKGKPADWKKSSKWKDNYYCDIE